MNIEILKDGAVYVGGVLDQELTRKNQTFYCEKLSTLLDEIVREIEDRRGTWISPQDERVLNAYNDGIDNAITIVEAKK